MWIETVAAQLSPPGSPWPGEIDPIRMSREFNEIVEQLSRENLRPAVSMIRNLAARHPKHPLPDFLLA